MKEVFNFVYKYPFEKSLKASHKCLDRDYRTTWLNIKEKVIIRTGLSTFNIVILKRFNSNQLEGAFENL